MEKEPGTLYLCPTPIGNLEDITLRALRILKEADIIAAEDTRVTVKLLNHYDIKTRQISCHEHNENTRGPELIELIKAGKDVAVVTDAGTPGISDPGARLAELAIKEKIRVVPMPGASAAICALVASGLGTERFAFEGFLPGKNKERKALLEELAPEKRTIILYESPHRIMKTLKDILDHLGDRQMTLAREMTKLHEEFYRGTVSGALKAFEEDKPRGEMVLVIKGASESVKKNARDKDMLAAKFHDKMKELTELGLHKNEALKTAAGELGIPRNEAYRLMLEDGGENTP